MRKKLQDQLSSLKEQLDYRRTGTSIYNWFAGMYDKARIALFGNRCHALDLRHPKPILPERKKDEMAVRMGAALDGYLLISSAVRGTLTSAAKPGAYKVGDVLPEHTPLQDSASIDEAVKKELMKFQLAA